MDSVRQSGRQRVEFNYAQFEVSGDVKYKDTVNQVFLDSTSPELTKNPTNAQCVGNG